MGNCCTKPLTKSSRSNSFTNLKFTSGNTNKDDINRTIVPTEEPRQTTNRQVRPLSNVPPVKCVATGNSLYNSLYNEQSSPYRQRKAGETPASDIPESNSRSASYRLRQEDVSGCVMDSNSVNSTQTQSSRESSKQNTLEDYREKRGTLTLEQHLIRGHKRSESSDRLKLGHIRSGSTGSNVLKDRSDSQRRLQADFIRKGNWTVSETKLKRNDSDNSHQPDVTKSEPKQQVSDTTQHPSILTDHAINQYHDRHADTEHQYNSSIHPADSPPPLKRCDSCKTELHPVLRGKTLQERRQVVSEMLLDISAISNSSPSDEENSFPNSYGDNESKSLEMRRAKLEQQLACHIKYKKGNLLGKGSFGKVYSALTEDGQIVAVKQIELDTTNWSQAEADYRLIQREVDIQKTLDHPNIVKFLDCGLDISKYTINILMEHVSGGTIASLLKKFGTFEETVFQRYTSQLIDATTYLHSNNVIHRDIKGSNIMVNTTGHIKLIDFGTAKRTTDDLVTPLSAMKLDFCIKGTPYWMAPEVVQMTGDPTSKADVWSIGCTVIEMATGSPPYFHMQPMSALFVIGSQDKPSPKLPEQFSHTAKDFVSQCLIKQMQKRPSAAELGKHTFILPEFIKKYPDNRGFYI